MYLNVEYIDALNNDVTGACHSDRKLLTGDSPMAANSFGKMRSEERRVGKECRL